MTKEKDNALRPVQLIPGMHDCFVITFTEKRRKKIISTDAFDEIQPHSNQKNRNNNLFCQLRTEGINLIKDLSRGAWVA